MPRRDRSKGGEWQTNSKKFGHTKVSPSKNQECSMFNIQRRRSSDNKNITFFCGNTMIQCMCWNSEWHHSREVSGHWMPPIQLIQISLLCVYIVAQMTVCKSRYHAIDISVLSVFRSLSRKCIRNIISASFKCFLCAFYVRHLEPFSVVPWWNMQRMLKKFSTAIAVDKLFWCLQCTQSFIYN